MSTARRTAHSFTLGGGPAASMASSTIAPSCRTARVPAKQPPHGSRPYDHLRHAPAAPCTLSPTPAVAGSSSLSAICSSTTATTVAPLARVAAMRTATAVTGLVVAASPTASAVAAASKPAAAAQLRRALTTTPRHLTSCKQAAAVAAAAVIAPAPAPATASGAAQAAAVPRTEEGEEALWQQDHEQDGRDQEGKTHVEEAWIRTDAKMLGGDGGHSIVAVQQGADALVRSACGNINHASAATQEQQQQNGMEAPGPAAAAATAAAAVSSTAAVSAVAGSTTGSEEGSDVDRGSDRACEADCSSGSSGGAGAGGRGVQTRLKSALDIAAFSLPLAAQNALGYSLSALSERLVGRLGPAALSAATLATSTYSLAGLSLVWGAAAGMETLCGQAYGAGNLV
ncbi:hypothetical protein Agub_g1446, partial [Astrephomene gubernaculifera]